MPGDNPAALTRRSFLQSSALAAGSGPQDRPNVLWLMADQFRYDCLGANGNRLIRTPNLDRLAAASANFSRAYVQAPVCVPSRISYLTGRYPHSHKNRVNYTPCDPRERFLQRMLKDAGYQTGSVGKLHFYPPTDEHARSTGFDQVLLDDGVASTEPYSDYVKWRKAHDPRASVPRTAVAKDVEPGGNPYRAAMEYQYTPTHWVGEQTRNMLRDFSKIARPFFLHASFFKPHSPFQVAAPYDAMYSGADIPLPPRVTLDDIQLMPLPLQKLLLRGRPEYAIPPDRLEWMYRSYYGAVSMVDHEMGQILEELEVSGRAGNTIVIFAVDHGAQLLEHGLMDKNVFFEASVHVPFLFRVPGKVSPGRHDELVEMVDVLPSILDFCGLSTPENVEGRSFAPLLTGQPGAYRDREMVFSENIIPEVNTGGSVKMPFVPGEGVAGIRHPDAKMVRTSRWKLNYYPGNGAELYDLRNDPGEMNNLASNPTYHNTVCEMKQELLDWMITAEENEQIAPRWLL